jgi:MFS family permease
MSAVDRRAMRLVYWNGAIWALGSGLASGPLVQYLAMEHDVAGIGVSIAVILAAPHLIGVLRLAVPGLLTRIAGRKPFCVAMHVLSGLALLTLAAAVAPGRLGSPPATLALTAALWCACQALEFLGMVALWSWLADLVPQAVRGTFLGRRECWMAAGQAAGMLAAGVFAWAWFQGSPQWPRWLGYAIPMAIGAALLMAAAVPLARMPEPGRRVRPVAAAAGASLERVVRSSGGENALETMEIRRQQRHTFVRHALAGLLAPLADRRFLRLLAVGCWLSIANGMIQSPQSIFPNRVLGMSLFTMLALKVGLRLGQWPVSPALGRLADRWGSRPLIAASLLVVAQGPLFYFLASPASPWWILAAWACWIAWAGINIGLPNLMLKLSPSVSNAALIPCAESGDTVPKAKRRIPARVDYIAVYYTATGLCHGLSTIFGGMLLDRYRGAIFVMPGLRLDYYHAAFLSGWVSWSLAAALMVWIVQEP